ncbi:hypothetical protein M2403_003150 [Rahnella sp. BIGb0603]|uniref:isochorismatase family protein n=1 Tax=Rahnella sp. BIGb0603 TaxID=2940612 RepID=UPI0021683818|nr:isochorismatase family protein [Rahnella sp. BIGb0603]MCS3424527.1 hypothetical protein [Rahnella sp. BIGb0603]
MINQQRRKLLGAGSLLAGVSALSLTANAMGAKATLAQNNNRNAENAIMAENVYLNLNDVQFLFADLHPALVNTSITNSPGQLAGNAGSLAKVASVLKIPMLFLTVTKGGVIPELASYANSQNTIFRTNADPFQEPSIIDALATNKRNTLIVAGYSTEVAVLLSVLGARSHDYQVHVVVDCIGSRSSRTESASLVQASQAGAVQTSVLTVAAQLAPEFSREPGKTILSIISDVLNRS